MEFFFSMPFIRSDMIQSLPTAAIKAVTIDNRLRKSNVKSNTEFNKLICKTEEEAGMKRVRLKANIVTARTTLNFSKLTVGEILCILVFYHRR